MELIFDKLNSIRHISKGAAAAKETNSFAKQDPTLRFGLALEKK